VFCGFEAPTQMVLRFASISSNKFQNMEKNTVVYQNEVMIPITQSMKRNPQFGSKIAMTVHILT
jgi:hypothetical protein